MEREPQIHSIRDYLKGSGDVVSAPLSLYRPEGKSRVLVVGSIHHRGTDGKVNTLPYSSARLLNSNDDPIQRKFKVGEEWMPLETGWIKDKDIGYIVLRNDGGKVFQVMPTEEQRQEELSRIIEVGYMVKPALTEWVETPTLPLTRPKLTNHDIRPVKNMEPVIPPILTLWLIHPGGEPLQGTPSGIEPMYLRCRHGEVTMSMMVVPN